MSEETQEERDEYRALLLDVAASLARKCVVAVTDAGLTSGQVLEDVDVAERSWHLKATFFGGSGLVNVEGQPHASDDEQVFQTPFGPMKVFSMGPEGDSFEFTLPATWLPGRLP